MIPWMPLCVLMAVVIAGPVWARPEAAGGVSMEETGETSRANGGTAPLMPDSVMQPTAESAPVAAGGSGEVVGADTGIALADTSGPATCVEARRLAELMRQEVRLLRERKRDAQTRVRILNMKVQDVESVIRSNEARIAAAEAEIARHSAMPADSVGVEDGYVAVRRERIEKHRSIIAGLRVTADSLARERASAIAGVRALEEQAAFYERRTAALFQLAERLDPRPMGIRSPIAFGYQCHYTSVSARDDGETHLVRMAGFHFSWVIRPHLVAGIRDVMLYFNETVRGTRLAVSFSPFVGAEFFPLRRLEIEGAFGMIFQGQTGVVEGNDGVVAPYVSVGLDAWPFKHFSVGPVVRVCYLAMGNVYAGAIPLWRSDVLPEGASWVDVGLSFSLHF